MSYSTLVDRYSGVLCLVTTPPEKPPSYKLIQHAEYPRGKTYIGKAEECTFEFKLGPEQIPLTPWVGTRVADVIAMQVTKHDAAMLDLKLYEDTTPTFWTNYRVIATSTASPVPWAIIIPAVLAILFIVAIIFLIREIKTIDWGKPAAAVSMLAILLGLGALVGVGLIAATKRKE